jgi:hypothetical protein
LRTVSWQTRVRCLARRAARDLFRLTRPVAAVRGKVALLLVGRSPESPSSSLAVPEVTMTRLYLTTLMAAAGSVLLQACGGMPQNAEEFRNAVPGAMMTKTESYEVNRPMREVAATFQRKAPECLNLSVRTVSQTTTSYQNILTEYKSTVVAGGERAELHLQQLHKTGVIYPSKPPVGGVYVIVADAHPLAGNRTRVQLYGPSMGYDVVYRAIRGWASGENLGCPDLTKIGKLSS